MTKYLETLDRLDAVVAGKGDLSNEDRAVIGFLMNLVRSVTQDEVEGNPMQGFVTAIINLTNERINRGVINHADALDGLVTVVAVIATNMPRDPLSPTEAADGLGRIVRNAYVRLYKARHAGSSC
jgi:hypothetical protein